MPGERRHPASGVAGSKPRQRIAKLPASEMEEASRTYLKERNEMMRLRKMREAMRLAVDREQLIERELVIKQLSYMAIAMRQRLLMIPHKMEGRLGSKKFDREMFELCTSYVHEALTKIADLPIKGIDPNWLERLEEEELSFTEQPRSYAIGTQRTFSRNQ